MPAMANTSVISICLSLASNAMEDLFLPFNVPTAIRRRLAVAIRANKLQVAQSVIFTCTIFVIEA